MNCYGASASSNSISGHQYAVCNAYNTWLWSCFLTLKRVMIDNAAWHLFFMHCCIRWWWNESETVRERRGGKGWRVKGRRGGVLLAAGKWWRLKKAYAPQRRKAKWRERKQNKEYDYTGDELQKNVKWLPGAEGWGSKEPGEVRKSRGKIKGEKW